MQPKGSKSKVLSRNYLVEAMTVLDGRWNKRIERRHLQALVDMHKLELERISLELMEIRAGMVRRASSSAGWQSIV